VYNSISPNRLPLLGRSAPAPAGRVQDQNNDTSGRGTSGVTGSTADAAEVPRPGSLPAALHHTAAQGKGLGLQYVSSDTAKAVFDKDTALFLDARDGKEFSEGHVPNALNLPPKAFRKGRPELLDYFPEDQLYIVYCGSSRQCGSAEIVARQMKIYGYGYVRVFRGGWELWKKAGWPEESDSDKSEKGQK
jgi:rhodanese-related sulfurtransferase